MTLVGRLGLAVAGLILAANADGTPGTVTATRSTRDNATTAAARASLHESDEADGVVDRYGNEVTDAVAKYSLDPGGSLYELHSPQTEIPRLGSPKS